MKHICIGKCGFLKEDYGIDFGCRYLKISWGKGLGFEATKTVIYYGFSESKIRYSSWINYREKYRVYQNS